MLKDNKIEVMPNYDKKLCEILHGWSRYTVLNIDDKFGDNIFLGSIECLYSTPYLSDVLLESHCSKFRYSIPISPCKFLTDDILYISMVTTKEWYLNKVEKLKEEKTRWSDERSESPFMYTYLFKDQVTVPTIKRIISSGPATIVFWHDGTKTVVKCRDEDEYDLEKGILWAIAKKHTEMFPKVYGNYISYISYAEQASKQEIDVIRNNGKEKKNARKTVKRTANRKSSKSS